MPYVQRGDLSIFYEEQGRGSAIVLLHPVSLNRYFWRDQIFDLARHHRVLVLDHRGHGASDKPASGYGIGAMAEDLLAVLDQAGVDRASLVGNSAGGMIAVQAALDAPDRVAALVVVSSATNLRPRVPEAVIEAYHQRFEAAFAYMTRGSTSARTRRERPDVTAFLEHASQVASNFTREVFLACIDDPDGVFHWNAAGRLGEIQQPTLVLAGEEDQAMPLDAVRALAGGIPRAELVTIPEVGHYFPLERPAEFNAVVSSFLARAGVA